MGWNYTGNKLHPTQKPVDLLLKLIQAFCPTSGVVLDPFMGSASTAVACIQSQMFNYLGYELDGNYFNLAMGRIAEEQGKYADTYAHNQRRFVNQGNQFPQAANDSNYFGQNNIKPRYKYNPGIQDYEPITPPISQGANDDYFNNRANAQGGYYG